MLVLDGYDVVETKYLGGMQIIVKFKSEKADEIFKANKRLWLKWFNRTDFLGDKSVRFERITWIKITSLLFLAWDESNFAAIARNFGKAEGEESQFHAENLETAHGDMGACGLGISAGINSKEKINSVCESLGGPTVIVPGSNNPHDACLGNDGSSNGGHGIPEHIYSPISNFNASNLEFEPGDSAVKRHRT
ncbi:unnamed protein product [Lactuca virosa]|uniref:DUF4283 domain-containing protein n=1 Tax=Lactuca virosa TaxID=75947 RepID=A0AAU9NGC7_9ASTR|nr:unnamed protein product [Lactuca virosa]